MHTYAHAYIYLWRQTYIHLHCTYTGFKFVIVEYGKVALAFHASGLFVALSTSYLFIVHIMGGIEPGDFFFLVLFAGFDMGI